MNRRKIISFIVLISIVWFASYLYRQGVANDIKEHKRYAIGKITKSAKGLKTRRRWTYEFLYEGKVIKNARTIDGGYDVEIGECYLVEFSYKNPGNSVIHCGFKYKGDCSSSIDTSWRYIPQSLFDSIPLERRWW